MPFFMCLTNNNENNTNIDLISVSSDTLTWDGNTDGLTFVNGNGVFDVNLYKVSDTILTKDDFLDNINFIISDLGNMEKVNVGMSQIDEISPGILTVGYPYIVSVAESAVGVDNNGLVFEEPGLYFMHDENRQLYLASITIPDHNVFEETKIDPKYLYKSDLSQENPDAIDYIKNKLDEEDAIKVSVEMGLVAPVADENNVIYTDENGVMYIL